MESSKLAAQVGNNKAKKDITEAYDDSAGHYENEAGVKKVTSPRPARDTKSPLGGLHGGK